MKAIKKIITKRLLEADEEATTTTGTTAAPLTVDALVDFYKDKIDIFSGYTPDKIKETTEKVAKVTQKSTSSAAEDTGALDISNLNQFTLWSIQNNLSNALNNPKLKNRINNNTILKDLRNKKTVSQDDINTVKTTARDLLSIIKKQTSQLKNTELDELETAINDFINDTNAKEININNSSKTVDEVIDYTYQVANGILQQIDNALKKIGSAGNTNNGSVPTTQFDILKNELNKNLEIFESDGSVSIKNIVNNLTKFNEGVTNLNDSAKKILNQLLNKSSRELNIFGSNNIVDSLPKNILLDKTEAEITQQDLESLSNTIAILNNKSNALKDLAINSLNINKVLADAQALATRAGASEEAKPKRDWKALLTEAAKNGSVEITAGINQVTKRYDIKGVWDLYFNEEWTQKMHSAAVGSKVAALGTSFTNEVLALGFDPTTNPFLDFLRIAFGPDHSLTIPSLNYSAVHNSYIDSIISTKDLRASNDSELKENNILFKQALYNVPAQDTEKYLKIQKICLDSMKGNKFTNSALQSNYSGADGKKDFIYAIMFVGGNPLTLTAPTNTEKLKPVNEIEALMKRCFDLEYENEKTGFSLDLPEVKEVLDYQNNQKDNAIELIKYLVATNNMIDKADEIFNKYNITNGNFNLASPFGKYISKKLKNIAVKPGALMTTLDGIAKYGGLI